MVEGARETNERRTGCYERPRYALFGTRSIALASNGQLPLSQVSDLFSTDSAAVKPSKSWPRRFSLNTEIKIVFVEQGTSISDVDL